MRSVPTWVFLLFLIGVASLPLWRAFSSGKTIGAFDQIRQMAPWSERQPDRPWDVLQVDSALQFYPWRDLVLRGWHRRELPLWNPYQLAGASLIGNSQSAPLYPPHILLGLLGIATPLAINILAWFHLSVAAIGCFLLVSVLGGSRGGAVFAGVSFVLSSFTMSWLALPSVMTTFCWLPISLAALQCVFQSATEGSSRLMFGSTFAFSLSSALMFLGGHLQFAAYGVLAIGLFVACRLASTLMPARQRFQALGLLLLGGAMAVGMAWPQLGVVLEYSKTSHRRSIPSEAGFQAYQGSALPLSDLAQRILDPMAQGNPTEPIQAGSPVSKFYPAISRTGANYAESAVTLGPLVLIFFLFALVNTSLQVLLPLVVTMLTAGLMAFGSPLNHVLYFYVPGWSATGSPGRAIALLVLMACVIAGLGLGGDPTRQMKQGFKLVTGLSLLFFLVSILYPRGGTPPAGLEQADWQALTALNVSGLSLAAILLFAALGFVAMLKDHARLARCLAVGSAILGAVVTGVITLPPIGSPLKGDFEIDRDPNYRYAAINEPWSLLMPASAVLPPNTATIAGIHDIAGYDSLLQKEALEALRRVNGRDPAPPANGNIMFVKPSADPKLLAELGVRFVLSRRPLPDWNVPASEWRGLTRYELATKGRVTREQGTVSIRAERYDGLVLAVSGDGPIVLRDRLYPGWQADSDKGAVGVRRHPAGMELFPPPGASWIELRYRPMPFTRGVLISASTFFFGATILLALPALKQRKRPYSGQNSS